MTLDLSQAPPSGTPIATHTTSSGTVTIFTTEALNVYMAAMRSSQEMMSTIPFLNQFKKYPRVTDLMTSYFEEFLKCTDNKLRIAPSILIGALSELLIMTLIKTAGEFLEDPNALSSYIEKKGDRKIGYTITIINKVNERIGQERSLTTEETNCFRKFSEIVNHMFDSIRLNRNEYAHPKPETQLSELPDSDSLLCQASAFNPYVKVIMELIDVISNLHSPQS